MPARAAGAGVELSRLSAFKPDLYHRAWSSIPHPTLPLIATAHEKSVTVFSLSTLSAHSNLTGGHTRSVRCAVWKPNLPSGKLCLVTASFDSTAGLWRWEGDVPLEEGTKKGESTEIDVTRRRNNNDSDKDNDDDWEFTLVLEGHENEIKSAAFSPSGQYLATCSRDKSIWIWEDVGANEGDDEWETVAVLTEHDGDVKCVAWCPDVPGRNISSYSPDVLASASYDDTIRIWREDGDGEWACVAVLEGHSSTVWGVQWEPKVDNTKFPRLISWSADKTIRVWTLEQDDPEASLSQPGAVQSPFKSGLGGIPNTMRRTLKEEWRCSAVLPSVHTRDIYSASWSKNGRVASTGSDGSILVYEECAPSNPSTTPADLEEGDSNVIVKPGEAKWKVLGKVSDGHGPYEINHITWCSRYDAGVEQRGVEEMLVTTGDDGIVQAWQLKESIEL
ncbi:Cytosolic iron-sulfur protein assembly protein [Pyricularia oryzae]|uniref:Probable cytosolic iron-sulfur protein assembly protein 1 n=5 Tax=Pyricularia TaxID=48558 RepID=CIAO1_PYRO7|nr:cytosolic iron-sulfur protein assembly protein 1 [Pyricularia oryzae 70-15]A4R7U3.2 RecName: Full=Probable cytosolic iron-sulfur protein assembly protein 1 [Pyricularia oryzae 70-15]ELQ41620.1 cytosolic iron-sulfur protein assembly protein 1 [Pyricularia oryzae Y34]KAH8843735.1 Cytosolic iron-sulfur protein assembly protein [Pyricularia oryzae]KAI6298290.1 Cytosolic iron-sulfur protein assembly protein [Pyricularia grisea]EHA50526.1 cytosolic iron-sulfur protein assembly protein 1 [Pyricula